MDHLGGNRSLNSSGGTDVNDWLQFQDIDPSDLPPELTAVIQHSSAHSDASPGVGDHAASHDTAVLNSLTTSLSEGQQVVEDADSLRSSLFSIADENDFVYPITTTIQDGGLSYLNSQETYLDGFISSPVSSTITKNIPGKVYDSHFRSYTLDNNSQSVTTTIPTSNIAQSMDITSSGKYSSCIVRSCKQLQQQKPIVSSRQYQSYVPSSQSQVAYVISSSQSLLNNRLSPLATSINSLSTPKDFKLLSLPASLSEQVLATSNMLSSSPVENNSRPFQSDISQPSASISQPTEFPSINEAIAKSEMISDSNKSNPIESDLVSSNSFLNKLLESNKYKVPAKNFKQSDFLHPSINQGLSGLLSNATDLPDKNLRAIIVTTVMTMGTNTSTKSHYQFDQKNYSNSDRSGLPESQENIAHHEVQFPSYSNEVINQSKQYNPSLISVLTPKNSTLQDDHTIGSLNAKNSLNISLSPTTCLPGCSQSEGLIDSHKSSVALQEISVNCNPDYFASSVLSSSSLLTSSLMESDETKEKSQFDSKLSSVNKESALLSQNSHDILLSDANLQPEHELHFVGSLDDELQSSRNAMGENMESNGISQEIKHSAIENFNTGLPSSDIFTANGIKTTFTNNAHIPHCTATTDMALSFSSNFMDNSNMSMDMHCLSDEDISVNTFNFMVPSDKNCVINKKSVPSDLSFSHLLLTMDDRRADDNALSLGNDFASKSKLPLLQAQDISKAVDSMGPEESKLNPIVEDVKFIPENFSEIIHSSPLKKPNKTHAKRKEINHSKDFLFQEKPCFICRFCQHICLEKSGMYNHTKQEHPEYLSDSDKSELEEQTVKTKRVKVFLPRTSSLKFPNQGSSLSKASHCLQSKSKYVFTSDHSKLSSPQMSSRLLPELELPTLENVSVKRASDVSPLDMQISDSNFSADDKFIASLEDTEPYSKRSKKKVDCDFTDDNDLKPCITIAAINDTKKVHQPAVKNITAYDLFNEVEVNRNDAAKELSMNGRVQKVQSRCPRRKQYTNKTGRPRAARTLGIAKMRKTKIDLSISEEELLGYRCDVGGKLLCIIFRKHITISLYIKILKKEL